MESDLIQRLERIESSLALLVKQHAIKDFHTTEEVGEILGCSSFTVREWCRQIAIDRTNGRLDDIGHGCGDMSGSSRA